MIIAESSPCPLELAHGPDRLALAELPGYLARLARVFERRGGRRRCPGAPADLYGLLTEALDEPPTEGELAAAAPSHARLAPVPLRSWSVAEGRVLTSPCGWASLANLRQTPHLPPTTRPPALPGVAQAPSATMGIITTVPEALAGAAAADDDHGALARQEQPMSDVKSTLPGPAAGDKSEPFHVHVRFQIGPDGAMAIFAEGPHEAPSSRGVDLVDNESEWTSPDGTRWTVVCVDVDPRSGAAGRLADVAQEAASHLPPGEAARMHRRRQIVHGLVSIAKDGGR